MFITLTYGLFFWYSSYVDQKQIHIAIGEAIRTRRKHLRFTQDELASRMGLSRASLANIETGRQAILVHHLYRIGEILEISPVDLLPRPQNGATSEVSVDDVPLPEDLNGLQRRQIQSLFKK